MLCRFSSFASRHLAAGPWMAAAVLVVFFAVSSGSVGQGAAPAATKGAPAQVVAEKGTTPSLPLKRAVLFSSGVGFFEHVGQVQGNAQVQMHFRVGDINDLLKSMVVQDLGGGQVSTVGYGSKDPVEKTLASFAIDLTRNPTLSQLLAQVRGERVEIEAPNKIAGIIVGVEPRRKEIDKDRIIETQVLNLLTDEGLRSMDLQMVSRIKLADEKLNAELQKALAVLATAHATDKKAVTLSFVGQGERKVRVGYVRETPIWKTSYRLVLEDQKAPYLQGWAIVENTTEDDWSGVSLTLVSGRPISFIMDLYQPLYIPRPTERLELYASLRPQTYDQDLARSDLEFRKRGEMAATGARLAPGQAMGTGMPGGMGGYGGIGVGAAPAPAARPARARRAGEATVEEALAEVQEPMDPRLGVKSAATAGEVGELFQYRIATPVSLPRRQSAMLPIVTGEIKGDKVSVYNPRVHPKHPLAGLKLTNSTELHLMQGPITVFDDGVYAGDAKIADLPPGSQRLVTYAMDLDTEVAPQSKGGPEQLVSVRLVKGTMITQRKFTRTQEYTVKNSGRRPKNVLIEQPIEPSWNLVQPKEPAEKTRDTYRFAVPAKPGEPAKLVVEEERIDQQQALLTNIDDNTIEILLRAKQVSDKVKAALEEVVKRKHVLAQATTKRGQLEGQIKAITEEQGRIRENMARLDQASDLYKRYVKKFTDQEDEIEKLRADIKELTTQETQLRKALDEYLMGLDLQ